MQIENSGARPMHTIKKSPFKKAQGTYLNNQLIRGGRAYSTDLDVWISYPVEYNGPDKLIDMDTINAALKTDRDATLSADGAAIKAGRLTIPADSKTLLEEFPNPPTIEDETAITIPGFADAVKAVFYAAATQDTRYYLNGVLLEIDDNGIVYVVATDGHRIERRELSSVNGAPAGSWIIPLSAARLIDSDDLELSETWCAAGDNLVFKQIDAKYPDWRRVVPKPTAYFSVDTKELLATLKQLVPFANAKYRGIKLTLANDTITLAAASPDRPDEVTAVLACDSAKGELVIGFNLDYMVDALKQKTAPTVTRIGYTNTKGILEINGMGAIMPMRL